MKVVQVNCVYPSGSTGKIVHIIHESLLKQGHESIVYYGRGKNISQENVRKVSNEIYSKFQNLISRISGIRYGGCFLTTTHLISLLKKQKPDVVHLQCINGHFVNIYKLVRWLNKNNIKTVLTMHAEFMYTANCSHAFDCEKWKEGCGQCPHLKRATNSILLDRTDRSFQLMKQSFNKFKNATIVSLSPWGYNRAICSPIFKDLKHEIVFNGVNTNIFKYIYDEKLSQENYIFHATAHFSDEHHHPKGGWAIIEMAKRMPDVHFYVASIRSDITHSLPDNITLLGNIKNQDELAKYYSNAQLTLMTSQREAFSMTTAESLCCATPVVGFKSGAPELIALKDYSDFCDYGDIDSLYMNTKKWLNKNIDKCVIENNAKEKYSTEKMVQSYVELYGGVL